MRRRLLWAALAISLVGPARADLLDYIAAPDPSYTWRVGSSTMPGVVHLDLTSQTWQGIAWRHTVGLIRPAQVRHPDLVILLISGGEPGLEEGLLGQLLANSLGVTFAVIWQIPNQPLWGMREDDLIAHTFEQLLATGDATWPLLFPMTKAAVRAMDAIQEYGEQSWGVRPTRFITTGASKRGWTTWLTAAADPRVVALMPMVYDNLNLAAQMEHQMELWGGYSPSIDDYTRRGLQQKLATPAGQRLAAMVDPYTYRERITQPKLIVNAANDSYWTVDALNLYRPGLGGETWQIIVPNAAHGINDYGRVIAAAGGFVKMVAGDLPRPELTWEHRCEDGQVILTMDAPAAQRASLWYAEGSDARFTSSTWKTTAMTRVGERWEARLPLPQRGDLALFGEASFLIDGVGAPFSTTVVLLRGPK